MDEKSKLKKNNRRPRDSYFLQQTFRTHYPTMTVSSWIPIFKFLSLIYLILGSICFYLNWMVVEYKYEYTDCISEFNINDKHNDDIIYCKDILDEKPDEICHCQILFYINNPIPKNVYIYYSIEYFYQNYMPYVDSIDDLQLCSKQLINDDCKGVNQASLPIVPCGMAANSMFNDTFEIKKRILGKDKNGNVKRYLYPIKIIRKNISWRYPERFRNPIVPSNETLEYAFRNTTKPSNWPKSIYELDLQDPNNNGFENEAFINWMQLSPFSSFRKAYGHIEHNLINKTFTSNGLQSGHYILSINYSYPVHRFNGKKFIIISNTSLMGGKNFILSYIFLLTSMINAIITIIFYFLHKRYGKISTQVYDYLYHNYEQDDRNIGDRYSRLKFTT